METNIGQAQLCVQAYCVSDAGQPTPLLLFGPCHPHWVRPKNLSAQLVSFEFESVMLKKK
jgi:hypothetical protein